MKYEFVAIVVLERFHPYQARKVKSMCEEDKSSHALGSVMDAEVRSENWNLFPTHNIAPSLKLHGSYTSPSFVVFNILSRQNLDH